jgi:DNA-binding NarL/FixJ family response regulator
MFKKLSNQIVGTIKQQADLLFIGDTNPEWQRKLDSASRGLGRLKCVTVSDLKPEAMIYDLYILDDAHIPNTISLIQAIKRQHQNARIIVMGDNPTWQEARAAFHAGVLDYIVWDDNYQTLHYAISENLHKQLGAGCG